MDTIDKGDIAEAFKGKLWTYTPVCRKDCKIGVAVANEKGFTPVPWRMTNDCGESYNEQKDYCNKLNAERGQSEEESLNIVASSMRGGVKKPAHKHTPGPWKHDFGDDGAVIYNDQGTIANVPLDMADYIENAELMTASPHLLEALRLMRDSLSVDKLKKMAQETNYNVDCFVGACKIADELLQKFPGA